MDHQESNGGNAMHQARPLSPQVPFVDNDLQSGWHELDVLLRGFSPGELTVITGYPSTCKSTLMVNLIKNICVENNVPSLFFSLQNPKIKIEKMLIASMAKVDYVCLEGNNPVFEEKRELIEQKVHQIEESPLYCVFGVDDIESICNISMQQSSLQNVKAIFVDSLQYIDVESNQFSKAGYAVRELKKLAIKLDVPVILTHSCIGAPSESHPMPYYPMIQPTTKYDPVLDSCDVMLVTYFPESCNYIADERGVDLRGKLFIGIEKNHVGRTRSMVQLYCLPSKSSVTDEEPFFGF